MIELLTAGGGKVQKQYPGPGSKVLVNGNDNYGYCGIVSASEGSPTVAQIITAAGMDSIGTVYTPPASGLPFGLFKFVMAGKVLYIPKYPLKRGLSWNQLYNAGVVYGDGTNGAFPTATPTLQNKTMQVTDTGNGITSTLKFRLARFVDQDPYVSASTTATAEFDKLLSHLMTSGADRWGNWFFSTLGWDNGLYAWTLTTYLTTNSWQRQIDSTGALLNKLPAKTQATANDCWWPVLELMP